MCYNCISSTIVNYMCWRFSCFCSESLFSEYDLNTLSNLANSFDALLYVMN